MSFIDKYYAIFNNSVGQHSVTIKRAEFANLLGVFSKQEQQLDKLKGENEEMKTKIKYMEEYIKTVENARNEVEQQLDKRKAENESLKDSLKMFSSTLDWALKSQVGLYKRQIDSSVPDDWEYEEVLVLVEQYIEKIKQTFTEIKEIAEILAPMTDEYEDCYDRDRCFECEFTDICKYFNIKQILQKISEVENGNNG